MKRLLTVLLLLTLFFALGCQNRRVQKEELSVLVYITGVITSSPTYELLAHGALEFAENNPSVQVKIYEAGMNQALWEEQLAQMIAGGEYDIVLGSNPSLPEICESIAVNFPDQKFIIVDAQREGHPNIKTYLYNQYEQSLMLGYLAGLITKNKKVGFVAAQEYPLLTRQMVPGFIEGARLVDPQIELDFRVVGSWADANKAAELASAMIDSGVDVFTSIAGGAAQGVIKTAQDRGVYIVWYNIDAYALAPGVIVGCGAMEIKKLVNEILNNALEDKIEYGISKTVGIKEGYLGFVFDNPSYLELPADVRERFELFYKERIQDALHDDGANSG